MSTLRAALVLLDEGPVTIRSCSRFFLTPFIPRGVEPDVVNAVVSVETELSPDDLLTFLHEIEARLDRTRDKRWTSRTLDLDLLTMDQKIAPDQSTLREWVNLDFEEQKVKVPERLILPHPRLQDRAFVLVPAMDVAPDWKHPLTGLTIRQMHDALPEKDREEVMPLEDGPKLSFAQEK